MTFPDAGTGLAGVCGHPVDHSASPPIHNAALRHDGVNAVYLAFDVVPDALADAVNGLRAAGCAGLNVTIPHKLAAAELADRRRAEVDRIGAANTLVCTQDGIEAANTDPAGIVRALGELGAEPAGVSCLVLGAGGAGRAAAWAVAEAGATRIVIANRTAARAEALAGALRAAGYPAEVVDWEGAGAAADGGGIILNATSVGLEGSDMPLSASALQRAAVSGCRGLLDLVYGRAETPFVRAARRAGLVAADGLGVLVHQAAEAYRLFWDRPAPVAVMHEAAARALGRRTAAAVRAEDAVPPLV